MPFQTCFTIHPCRRLLLGFSGALLVLALKSSFSSDPSYAAEEVAFRYEPFEETLSVKDLQTYAQTQKASSELKSFLSLLGSEKQQALQTFLQIKLPLNVVTLDKLLDQEVGKKTLAEAAKVTIRRDNAGSQALRAAFILGSLSQEGLGLVSFLEAYPSQKITIDVLQAPKLLHFLFGNQFQVKNLGNSSQQPLTDELNSEPWWQLAVQYQDIDTQNKQYSGCLFGDSISSGVGNTLGGQTYNFALPSLSTTSLVEQLKTLIPANVKCQKAIIAIGTNDALYGTRNGLIAKKTMETIALVQSLGATTVTLIPAFYSTVAASQQPVLAGTNSRVDEINALLRQVATTEKVTVEAEDIQPLFKNRALKENLTIDGVHLNAKGIKIYRQALLKILNSIH